MSHITTARASLIALAFIPLAASADHALPEGYEAAPQECAIASDLGLGSRSGEVACLQEHLIEDGVLSIGAPTGYFGERTKTAVAAWQKAHGIAPTGFFGALSRAAFSGEKPHDTGAPQVPAAMHKELDVSEWPAVPRVSIAVRPDAMSGYNLEIQTENFTFAPQRASSPALPGEGHAHLMVDGKKIARVYGNWFHIPADAIGNGTHEVLVTLNGNDHSDLMHEGRMIAATTTITR